MRKRSKALASLNVSKVVCDHLVGERHTSKHRITVGSLIMIMGVSIAKSSHGIHIVFFEYILDLVGYLIHGIGAIPFIEHIQAQLDSEAESEVHDSDEVSE